MYLKGLFIGDSTTSRSLKFGYNLAEGKVNRNRQRLTHHGEQAAALANIWAEAIQKNPEATVGEYTKMLREDDEKQWADVNNAMGLISEATARVIWEHLKQLTGGRNIFFHDKNSAEQVCTKRRRICGDLWPKELTTKQNAGFIRKHLKKTPEALPACIWEPLKKYGLVQTPDEYAHGVMQNAGISDLESTTYSDGVKRALSAVLALDERTEDRCRLQASGRFTAGYDGRWKHPSNQRKMARL